MRRIGRRIQFSATDLTKHLACPHVTTLDRQVAQGVRPAPEMGVDEQLQLIFDKGIAHEQAYLAALRARFSRVVEIEPDRDRARAESATVAAMASGADVIYQAALDDGSWTGYADFLLRRDDTRSRFGSYAYDIADTKLARRLKVPALLQLATYAERLETLQGVAPRRILVVTGDGEEHPWRLLDVSAYARRARHRLVAAVEREESTEAVPVPYCAQCRWVDHCSQEWESSDDLSLVAGMRAAHREALRSAGITTTAALAEAAPADLGMLSATVRMRLHEQARLQVSERLEGQAGYRLLPPLAGKGMLRLPEPDTGDLYLDFEGDPFAEDGAGREYLAGLCDRSGTFTAWWAHDSAAEAAMVEGLLAHLVDQWRRHPDMHVYHYAAYEPSALKRLTGRYGVGEGDLDALLRGERFVDLYTVVRQGLQISKPSYSIKKLEEFYWGRTRPPGRAGARSPDDPSQGAETVGDAMSSVVEYERFLLTGDQAILDRIRDYNRDDVLSTHALHDWLEERRTELLSSAGVAGQLLGEPSRPVGDLLEESADSDLIKAEKELAGRLLAAGDSLTAGLVGWHRREDRPEYWEFFARAEMSDDELVESSATAGRLGEPVVVGDVTGKGGRVTSRIHRYEFPPQDCALSAGDAVFDVDTRDSAGTIIRIDPVEGWVEVKRSVRHDPSTARAFGPGKPISNQVLRQAIARAAEARLDGSGSTADALIDRRVPRYLVRLGEDPQQAVVRVGSGMNGQVLAVQGPPGSGKTRAGAELIRALLDGGFTVGVTALSHAVIKNLLTEVGRPAWRKGSERDKQAPAPGATAPAVDQASSGGAAGAAVSGSPGDGPGATQTPARSSLVTLVNDNDAVEEGLRGGIVQLVGGTAWLWSRPQFERIVDVLVIDEAGQFSLANAVAVAGAARSVVLLGDPQQLAQPTKADHPHGAHVSALEHLIGDRAVIAETRGLFLDRTWRMHPGITSYVSDLAYDGRLASAPGREQQSVVAPGRLTGAGIRWVPVEHTGNVAESPQEASVVGDLVADLLCGTWTDHDGHAHPMTPADVLVIAPYNAHVRALRAVLPQGVRVGTVDRFQGQQAPVVVYSMASSSSADAPRGVGFLFDVHRMTVAVSRARALVAVVASPALLDAPVRDPGQLRAVNALCEYVDRAQSAVGSRPDRPADGLAPEIHWEWAGQEELVQAPAGETGSPGVGAARRRGRPVRSSETDAEDWQQLSLDL